MSISIIGKTLQEYQDALFSRFGRGRQHAAFLYNSWMQSADLSKCIKKTEPQAQALLERFIEFTDFSLPAISKTQEEGNVVKFLLKFSDRLESESVLIPMEAGNTLCISSQVGCKMGCAFCETGKMGLLRNLGVEEIVSQVFVARFLLKKPVRNLVFMGMGEPFDNFDNVIHAVRVLTDQSGLRFGSSRITISTSGVVEGIYRLIEEADPALNLAVSINAPNDQIRAKIMPVNKKWDMQALKDAMIAYCAHPRREIFGEYVLLQDVNDSLEHADELVKYLEGLKVRINLIPYNPQSKDRFSPPSLEKMDAFLQRLRKKGCHALVRHPKGHKIMAACGQLGNKQLKGSLIKNLGGI